MSGLLAALRAHRDRPGIMATVVEARGSTPRETGAFIIVGGDGRLVTGTVGGGALEHRALEAAKAILDGDEDAGLRDISLGPELGQCCGGRVTLLFEQLPLADVALAGGDGKMFLSELGPTINRRLVDLAVVSTLVRDDQTTALARLPDGRRLLIQPTEDPRQPLAVFGAGHVGRAVVWAVAPLPFAVTWIDSRADQFDPPPHGNPRLVLTAAPADQVALLPAGAFLLVMTHSHALDYDICRRALARDDLGYVGLIGSSTKRARFLKRFAAHGLSATAIGRLTCPIGRPEIAGKAPSVIAASVAADLLIRGERQLHSRTERPGLKVAS